MQSRENKGVSPPPSRRSAWLSTPRAAMVRSFSPEEFELDELLHVRTMHSFTRRMKSFNKDRNPDLVGELPSYMRQTCASLIKRPRSRSGDFNKTRTTTPESARRPTSVGAELHHRPRRTSRRTHSSLSQMQGMSVALNDKLGFLLEDMPEGLDWSYEHGMMDSGEIRMINQNENKKQSRNQHKRSKSGKVREVKTVKTAQKRSKSRADGMQSLAGSSSRKPSHRRTQSSVAASDPKSDAANNTSPGKVEEWDFMSVQIGIEGAHSGHCEVCEEERCPRPMSTLPLKEMDVTAHSGERSTPRDTPEQNTDHWHSDEHNGRDPLLESEFSIDEEQALQAYRSRSEQEQDLEFEEKSSPEATDGNRKEGQSVGTLETELEAVKQDGVLDGSWRSPAYTTATADNVLDISEDEAARKIASQDSVDVFTDALSRSRQSSGESDVERELELADKSPSKKSFFRRRKLNHPSKSEEASTTRKSKRPKFLTAIGTRLSKGRRSHCCRFSFKACFCGADVSPGPEQDDDLTDPQTQEQ